jgi:uncharacterized protein YkwD
MGGRIMPANQETEFMNLKNLNKKIRRLVTRIEKDTKKLARLRLKLTAPARKKERSSKKKKSVAAHKPKTKKKRTMSTARRAQLAAAMNARWAAKRAAANPSALSPDISAAAGAGGEPQTI